VGENVDLEPPPPGRQLPVARELLERSGEPQWTPDERFVLLRRAMELGKEGGDAELMVEAVEMIGQGFDVDALSVQSRMLAAFAKTAHSKAQIQSLCAAACKVADAAIDAGRLDLGLNLLRGVYEVCKCPEGADYRQAIYDRGVRIRRLQKQER
jgi:hypothetical protein